MLTASTYWKILLVAGILFTSVLPASADVPASPDSSLAYLEVLSDPSTFAGRKSGLESGTASQTWIAGKLKEWGLKPLIGESLLISFPMLATEEKKARLTIYGTDWGKIDFLLGDDFTLTTNSGSGSVHAPVTLVGHGFSKPEKGWDDYQDMDVSGRIVVIFRGQPSNGEDWTEEYSRTYTLGEATKRGAVGVLFYDREFPVNGAAISEQAYSPTVPSAYIGDRVLSHLFRGSGTNMKEYKRALKKGPNPLELTRELRLQAKEKRIPDGTGYNVAGVIPGLDPSLKGEAVIVGAHGDHLGPNALGMVYTGADDNGSGSCVVMELARVFAMHPQPRTLIFSLLGGEEQGLLGSKALAEKLPERYTYVNMVNLDMVGRGEGVFGIGGGDMLAEVWNPWWESLPDSIKKEYVANRAWGGSSSDHAPFRDKGIPAFTCYSKGDHDYYHSTEDRYRTIHKKAIAGALTGAARWLEAVASFPEPLGDRDLAARTLWHQAFQLFTLPAGENVEKDRQTIRDRLTKGFNGAVWELSSVASSVEDSIVLRELDRMNDVTGSDPKLAAANSLKDLSANSYRRKASVFLAVSADSLLNEDSTRWQTCYGMGVRWVKMNNWKSWVENGEILAEKTILLDQIAAKTDGIVELPLENLESWLPVIEETGGKTLLVGDWQEFRKLDRQELNRAREKGARILVEIPMESLGEAIEEREKIESLKVHVQPLTGNYETALSWIDRLQEAGLDKKQVLNWIGGHLKRW